MKIAENLEWRVNKIVTSEPCTWVSYIQNYFCFFIESSGL